MFQIDMAKKKAPAKKPAGKKSSSGKCRRAVKPKPQLTTIDGEPYDIKSPGEVRRRHKDHEAQPSEPSFLNIDQKFEIINALLSKLTAGASCDELGALADHVTKWAGELEAVHRHDIKDCDIQEAKIFYPSESVFRLLKELIEFQHRADIDDDAAVDFIVRKLHGDHSQPTILN